MVDRAQRDLLLWGYCWLNAISKLNIDLVVPVPFLFVLPQNPEQLEIDVFIPLVSCYMGISNLKWLVSVRRWLIHWHQGFHLLSEGSIAMKVKVFPHLTRHGRLAILIPLVPWYWLGEDDNVCFRYCHYAWCHVSRFDSSRECGVWIWCGNGAPWLCYKRVLWSEDEV